MAFPSPSFTGKEKDEETGYGYFGARYMDHELMTMWLSVDPLADKYPSISPYAYCTWNPVKLVDPDGMDTIVSINTKKPTRTRITGRGDLGTARKLHNRYVTNRNLYDTVDQICLLDLIKIMASDDSPDSAQLMSYIKQLRGVNSDSACVFLYYKVLDLYRHTRL